MKTPRNALIALSGLFVAAAALCIALLIPWNQKTAPLAEKKSAGAAVESQPAPAVTPPPETVPPPNPSLLDVSAEPSLAGLEPTRISVEFGPLSPSAAVEAFAEQTNFRAALNASAAYRVANFPPFAMRLHEVPLLEGLFQLCHGADSYPIGLSATSAALLPQNRVTSPADQFAIGKWCISGPFAMVIRGLTRDADLGPEFGRPASPSAPLLSGSFYADPALEVIQYPSTFAFERFTDNKDQAITVAADAMRVTPHSGSLPRVSFALSLAYPASPGHRIAMLRARARFVVATKFESLTTTAADQTLTQRVGQLDIDILPIKAVATRAPPRGREGAAPPDGPQEYSVQIHYRRAGMDDATWQKLRPALPSVEPLFLGPAEQRITAAQRPILPDVHFAGDSISAAFTVTAGPAAQPTHLRLNVPLEIREVSVPFEFKDLILP